MATMAVCEHVVKVDMFTCKYLKEFILLFLLSDSVGFIPVHYYNEQLIILIIIVYTDPSEEYNPFLICLLFL